MNAARKPSRRATNLRIALLLAAVALAFYLAVIFRIGVFGS